MSQPVVLVVDPDLSTRALVEASLDPEMVSLRVARDVSAARVTIDEVEPALIFLSGELEEAAEFLLELDAPLVYWLGDPEAPGAAIAKVAWEKPLDIVALQLALEAELGLTPTAPEPPPPLDSDEELHSLRVVQSERDALLAENEVLRHETAELQRRTEAQTTESQHALETLMASHAAELEALRVALDAQRRTAESLQTLYGEVEQARGNLRQRYEALEAERDALAERSREVSELREELELAQRENQKLWARLAQHGETPPSSGVGVSPEASGWWQEALKEATD